MQIYTWLVLLGEDVYICIPPVMVLFPVFLIFLFGCFLHRPFNIQACHFRFAIGPDGYCLFEVSRIFALAVISYVYLAFFSRCDRLLCVRRNRASAGCHGLVYDKWRVANVGESEHAFLYGIAFGELSEVACQLVKFYLCLSRYVAKGQRKHSCNK